MSEDEIIEALNEIAARFREQHLCGYEHVVNAVALIVQQQAQIARVRELHHPSQSTIWSHDSQQAITVTTCRCGSEQYPCETIRAIEEER